MTNEKAIKFFKEQHKSPACFISLEEWRDFNDALDLAIEALRKQDVTDTNVGDMVSRQAAIDAVVDELDRIDHVPQWVFDVLSSRIKSVPSAEPQERKGKWIEDKGQQTLMKNFIEMGEVWRVCSVCGAGARDRTQICNR